MREEWKDIGELEGVLRLITGNQDVRKVTGRKAGLYAAEFRVRWLLFRLCQAPWKARTSSGSTDKEVLSVLRLFQAFSYVRLLPYFYRYRRWPKIIKREVRIWDRGLRPTYGQ